LSNKNCDSDHIWYSRFDRNEVAEQIKHLLRDFRIWDVNLLRKDLILDGNVSSTFQSIYALPDQVVVARDQLQLLVPSFLSLNPTSSTEHSTDFFNVAVRKKN